MSSSFLEGIEDDDIEELIRKAEEESLRFYNEVERPRLQQGSDGHKFNDHKQENILSTQEGGKVGTILYEGIEAKGFHLSAGSTYIYPTNYPVRQYQASIVRTALFKNTLVSLPTGLGKTFIAAVVMYNFYRWYPNGKVVFMAPTRPLVAQQTKACHNIMNIPQEHTTEMTGLQNSEQRTFLWREKRVFYLTPQVMVNDLKMNTCPASLIKCVVIDEAHKATKDYAYCQVLKILSETDAVFRVLGLSATPGSDVNAVQQVIKNLHISALELRSEESLDVAPYTHSRAVDKVVVELPENLLRVKEDLLMVFEKYSKKIRDLKALPGNISTMTKFQVLKACEKFRANPPKGLNPSMMGNIISDFTVCMSLAHSLELLQIYGLRAFYKNLADENGEKSKPAASRLKNDEHLKEMLKRLHACLYPKPADNVPYIWGHPKLKHLVNCLSDHFQKAQENKESTKAIVFCQFRIVVSEIVELLGKYRPLIKATEFIGQSGGKEKGMPQAKQLQIMKDFRNGLINCLVATCVAEEGLDIGEVDLIILMDSFKSPVRLVQRIGRTGRKRKGKCIVLLTKGKEEQKFQEAMSTRKSYVQNIINAPAVKSSLCQETPRMIPQQCNPIQQLVHIQVTNFDSPLRQAGKKQVDIRNCFTAQAAQNPVEESLLKAIEELGDPKIKFGSIPSHQELWPKRHGAQISVEELFSDNVNGLSEWNEWNYEEHPTFFISHTPQTKLLCHILKTTNKESALPKYVTYSEEQSSTDLTEENKLKNSPLQKNTKDCKTRRSARSKVKNNTVVSNCVVASDTGVKRPEMISIILSDDEVVDTSPIISEPLLKKPKISEADKEEDHPIRDDTTTSLFEYDINMCELFGKYSLPKKETKKMFTFKENLPVLENLLQNSTYDLLYRLDFTRTIIKEAKIEKSSLITSDVGSPSTNYFFDVDDLFDDDDSGDDYEAIDIAISNGKTNIQSHENITPSIGPKPDIDVTNNSKPNLSQMSPNNNQKSAVNDILNNQIISENVPDIPIKVNSPNSPKDKVDFKVSDEKAFEILSDEEEVINFIFDVTPKEIQSKQSDTSKCPEVSAVMEDCLKISNAVNSKENKLPAGNNELDKLLPAASSTPKRLASVTNKNDFMFDLNDTQTEPLTNGLVCSTPIISVKKFKKNILKFDNNQSSPIMCSERINKNVSSPVKLNKIIENSPSSDESDMWNLSDLFDEDDGNKVDNTDKVVSTGTAFHDSSMMGITQMVSLIEKEKEKNVNRNGTVKTVLTKSDKKSNFTAFLDSDVDIFADIQDNIQFQQHDKAHVNDKSDILKPNFSSLNITNYNNEDLDAHSKGSLSKETNNDAIKHKANENHQTVVHSCAIDSQQTQVTQHVQQSQGLNYKKFSSKKILFSQKSEPSNYNKKTNEICSSAPQISSYVTKNFQKEHLNTTVKGSFDSLKLNEKDTTQAVNDDSDDDVFQFPFQKKSSNHKKIVSFKRERSPPFEDNTTLLRNNKDLYSPENRKSSLTKSTDVPCKKSKTIKASNDLIEREADVSGFDSTDDSEGSSLDNLDNSFINDNTECIANCTETMYLKSVKSPLGHGKFKIPSKINYEANVFSQMPEQDSEYMNDSFCVDTEEEPDDSKEKSMSFLEAAEQFLSKKQKNKKKRRRILNLTSDDSSPEHISPKPSQKRKRNRLISDSEEEEVLPKKLSNNASQSLYGSPSKEMPSFPNELNGAPFLKGQVTNFRHRKVNKESNEQNKKLDRRKKLDEKLESFSKKMSESLDKIRGKYFGSNDSSDD